MSPLQYACRLGHMDIVELLIHRGADLESLFGSSLRQAVDGGELRIARMLLSRGASVNEGLPPQTLRAVELEHIAMFNLLQDRGAILHTQETGRLALKIPRVGVEGRAAPSNRVDPNGSPADDSPMKIAMGARYHGIVQYSSTLRLPQLNPRKREV
jgi:hypothetical protein